MPVQFRAYKPDLKPDKAVGILLPFNGTGNLINITRGYNQIPRKDVKPFVLSYSTEEQAISNLVNLLLTRKGERPMQPTLGSLIPEFIFEPNTQSNRDRLRDSIESDINFFLPYIRLNEVRVEAIEDRNSPNPDIEHNIIISIAFKVTEVGANRTVTIFVEGDSLTYQLAA